MSIELKHHIHLPSILESVPVHVLHWPDEQATRGFARRLAAQPGIVDLFVTLHGELGAGKTTLVRHLLQALGVTGRIKSPTYAVVEPYRIEARAPDSVARAALPLDIWHFDFYRFADPREWEDAGFRDIFASPGLKLAEWPDKAAPMLPVADLAVHIEALDGHARRAILQAATGAGAALLQALRAPADAEDAP